MSYEVKVARTRRKLEAAVAKGDDEAVIDLKEKLSKRAAKLGRDEPGSREAAAAKAVLSSIAAAKKDGATKNKNKSSRGDGDVPGGTKKRRKVGGGSADRRDKGDDAKGGDDTKGNDGASSLPSDPATAESGRPRTFPPAPEPPKTGDTTILLFYGYVRPLWSKAEHGDAVSWAYETLKSHGCTGRLRVAREGVNGTLTGPGVGIRAFTAALAVRYPKTFGGEYNQFKYVDDLPENQMLKGLKVWPVAELVTYGFDEHKAAKAKKHGGSDSALARSSSGSSSGSSSSSSGSGGGGGGGEEEADKPGEAPGGARHLSPESYHEALQDPEAVVIDVRNFNESLIGKFAPGPGRATVLDPEMRRSTEFPQWVDDNLDKLRGKKVLMYCTGGIRCERASAYLTGPDCGLRDVNQLEGGIHRYLEAYPDDGGLWVGKNYTFDKRFSHGAAKSETISECVVCREPWERYQAQLKCIRCKMEVIVCKTCTRNKKTKPIPKSALVCPLCDPKRKARADAATAKAALAHG